MKLWPINLLEFVVVDCGNGASAKREARLRNAPSPAARRMVHVVGQTGERDVGPRSANHQIRHLGEIRLLRIAHFVQARAMTHAVLHAAAPNIFN